MSLRHFEQRMTEGCSSIGYESETDPISSRDVQVVRIQVKTYRKTYLTKRKGNYQCRSYFIYIPKELAEPLVGKDLRLTKNNSGIIIEPAPS